MPGATEGFRKKANFGHLAGVTKQPTQQQFRGFWGGPWLGLYGLGGHYVGPHGCSSTRIVTKASPKPMPGATEGFRKKANFGHLAGVTKQPTQQQFRGFWRGPWLGLYGLGGHYVGPHGCSSTRIVTKSSPKPMPGATEGFRKKANFGHLAGVTKQPTQQQFRGFWGGHGSGYMGLAATTWVPMGAKVPILSLNHHPNPSQGRQEGFQKSRILEILQVSLNSLHNSNFGAFGGAMAWAIWAWRPLRGSPWVLKYPYCH